MVDGVCEHKLTEGMPRESGNRKAEVRPMRRSSISLLTSVNTISFDNDLHVGSYNSIYTSHI